MRGEWRRCEKPALPRLHGRSPFLRNIHSLATLSWTSSCPGTFCTFRLRSTCLFTATIRAEGRGRFLGAIIMPAFRLCLFRRWAVESWEWCCGPADCNTKTHRPYWCVGVHEKQRFCYCRAVGLLWEGRWWWVSRQIGKKCWREWRTKFFICSCVQWSRWCRPWSAFVPLCLSPKPPIWFWPYPGCGSYWARSIWPPMTPLTPFLVLALFPCTCWSMFPRSKESNSFGCVWLDSVRLDRRKPYSCLADPAAEIKDWSETHFSAKNFSTWIRPLFVQCWLRSAYPIPSRRGCLHAVSNFPPQEQLHSRKSHRGARCWRWLRPALIEISILLRGGWWIWTACRIWRRRDVWFVLRGGRW